ncbi:MAG: hypothetical protein KKI09_02980 [Spirochaetes bacterium]|nr:hypothetical protein [Spirochaetota bacterium]MBU0954369.1 hypothetical protein [Spirochaetota bacterium]
MKKLFAVMVLVLMTVTVVFAAGSKDVAELNPAVATTEEVKLTGTVHQNIGQPMLFKAEGKEYYVMLPVNYLSDIEIAQGETVTVEGVVVTHTDAVPAAVALDKPVLHVYKATIKGTEYVFVNGARGAMMGGMPGMMGGNRGGRGGMMGAHSGYGQFDQTPPAAGAYGRGRMMAPGYWGSQTDND